MVPITEIISIIARKDYYKPEGPKEEKKFNLTFFSRNSPQDCIGNN